MANRRKSDSPQKAALREMMGNFMKENDIQVKDGTDVNSIMRDMMSIILEGMSTSDIESHMRELYDIEISDSTISRVTDKVLPLVKEWQERPLEEVYAVVFMDAIHYHVQCEGRIVKRAVYIAIGIDMSGYKDLRQLMTDLNQDEIFAKLDKCLEEIQSFELDLKQKTIVSRRRMQLSENFG